MAVFGIGSMIYSGIEMGMVIEMFFEIDSRCKNIFSIIRPMLQLTYVFVQMYFVFLNQKVSVIILLLLRKVELLSFHNGSPLFL